jgi:hypothetical protein
MVVLDSVVDIEGAALASVTLSIDCDNSGRISTRCYLQFVKDFRGRNQGTDRVSVVTN